MGRQIYAATAFSATGSNLIALLVTALVGLLRRGVEIFVPTAALEHESRRGDDPLERAATLLAQRLLGLAPRLRVFEALLALLALVLVDRHVLSCSCPCYRTAAGRDSVRITAACSS